jgi:hypothetical protein
MGGTERRKIVERCFLSYLDVTQEMVTVMNNCGNEEWKVLWKAVMGGK